MQQVLELLDMEEVQPHLRNCLHLSVMLSWPLAAWFRGGLPHHQVQLAAKTGPSKRSCSNNIKQPTALLGHYYHLPDLLPWIAIGLCWICTATCDDWRCLFGVPKHRSQPAIRCTPILLSSLKRSTSRNLCLSPCNTKKLMKNDTKDHKSDFSKIDINN